MVEAPALFQHRRTIRSRKTAVIVGEPTSKDLAVSFLPMTGGVVGDRVASHVPTMWAAIAPREASLGIAVVRRCVTVQRGRTGDVRSLQGTTQAALDERERSWEPIVA